MEECIKEELPATTELEEGLRNGVILAKLGHFMAPTVVPLRFHIFVPADIKSRFTNSLFKRRIFDSDQSRWRRSGLHFKHTDNIVHFMNAAKQIGLPPIFLPETTDIYDRKNMPRYYTTDAKSSCSHQNLLSGQYFASTPSPCSCSNRAQLLRSKTCLGEWSSITRTSP